jgi:Gpi18-like mannosyltransferase
VERRGPAWRNGGFGSLDLRRHELESAGRVSATVAEPSLDPATDRRTLFAAASLVVMVGVAVRVVLLPTPGLPDDLDKFVGWVHHIATGGFATLYGPTDAGPVTFGPVMAYIWGLLALVDPAFATVTDAADPTIRILMKLPATVADLGIALVLAFALRKRPGWAIAGAAAFLLHPAVIDLSAWWGQYEPIYLLAALISVVLAIEKRPNWAAVAIAVSLMTKPQAVAFVIPFAAGFLATGGWRGLLRAAAIGAVTIAVLWLPFVMSGGPANYLRNLGEYQGQIFNYLSLRAWNLWWLVQGGLAGDRFVRDDLAVLGPVTARNVGYALAGLLNLVIAAAIIIRPSSRTLILGLTASVLVVFTFATQMHERYAYGAVVFLALLVAEPAARWLGLALGIVFTLNLLAAIPPTPEIGAALPVTGALGVAGSIGMLAITYWAMRMLASGPPDRGAAPSPLGP